VPLRRTHSLFFAAGDRTRIGKGAAGGGNRGASANGESWSSGEVRGCGTVDDGPGVTAECQRVPHASREAERRPSSPDVLGVLRVRQGGKREIGSDARPSHNPLGPPPRHLLAPCRARGRDKPKPDKPRGTCIILTNAEGMVFRAPPGVRAGRTPGRRPSGRPPTMRSTADWTDVIRQLQVPTGDGHGDPRCSTAMPTVTKAAFAHLVQRTARSSSGSPTAVARPPPGEDVFQPHSLALGVRLAKVGPAGFLANGSHR